MLDTGRCLDLFEILFSMFSLQMANLADLTNNREMLHMVPLYETGLLELKHGSVPCRTLRAEMAHCVSDVEFLAKLHGVRLAFEVSGFTIQKLINDFISIWLFLIFFFFFF